MKKVCLLFLTALALPSGAMTMDTDLIPIKGGEFTMGSAEDVRWRGTDESQHQVKVDDFLLGKYEVSQALYEEVMGNNPSLNQGKTLPVENITWIEAVTFCNELSRRENLKPVYTIRDSEIIYDMEADGYRLPDETEWEYACRGGTTTNYSSGYSISADDANYCGHYPYDIEPNYFNPEKLKVQPGIYRQHPVNIDSFTPNAFGLYNMHGNVCEWVNDTYHGDYNHSDKSSVYKVYRGGGYNDFAKHIRSAYRGVLPPYLKKLALGLRLARNAGSHNSSSDKVTRIPSFNKRSGKGLVVFFSWSNNTRNMASIISAKTGSDILELTPAKKDLFSENYSEVLVQAWQDQFNRTEPELLNLPEDLDSYDTVYIGYPLWWASIPRPVVSFLKAYDFSKKKIMIFSSGGGGHMQQSASDLMKECGASDYGSLFEVSYSGGRDLDKKIEVWLQDNNLK